MCQFVFFVLYFLCVASSLLLLFRQVLLFLQRFRPLPMGMDFLLLNLQKYRKLLMAVCLLSLLMAMVMIALSILL